MRLPIAEAAATPPEMKTPLQFDVQALSSAPILRTAFGSDHFGNPVKTVTNIETRALSLSCVTVYSSRDSFSLSSPNESRGGLDPLAGQLLPVFARRHEPAQGSN